MGDAADFRRLLAFIPEPLLVVEVAGTVALANPAARTLLGADPQGADLGDLVEEEPDRLKAYLRRCSGSGSPLPGSLVVRTAEGPRKLQAQGACFARGSGEVAATVVLRLRGDADSEFTALARKVGELNREVGERRRAQAALEEALQHKEALLQELHHRVKNHTQMLLGMLSMAARDATGDEVRNFIAEFRSRLLAVGAAQQLMYQAGELASLPARDFLATLCGALSGTWPEEATIASDADELALRNDVTTSLALIVNELTANALKHGLRYGAGRVEVTLRRRDGEIVLTVWDSGPGWCEPTASGRSSGLALVRGLCRQIGGDFDISRTEGTSCIARFPSAVVERTRP